MRKNSSAAPVVVTEGPEKVGHLAGPHGERVHHLEGVSRIGPHLTEAEQAQLARFDAPVEPIDLPEVERRDAVAPGPHGDVPVRVYTPAELAAPDAEGRRAAVVWIHGGAFIFGDLDTGEADHTAARLADATGLPVISVAYRLCRDGIHHPVPHDDCWAAYQWVRAGGHGLPTDPERVAVGGGSAGACLAATIGLHGRDADCPPAGVFLAYPLVHYPRPPASTELAAAIATLPPALVDDPEQDHFLMGNYLGPDLLNIGHPGYALPGMAEDLTGYPRTFIENCELDTLRVSGERFAAQLEEAGVDVEQHTVPGEIHGHLSVPGLPTAKATCAHFAAFISDVTR
ncbi:Acetyl esterase/lipase [Actinomyces ruminicola]|uniref:Acetyl esterase/lipase n=1 Tax=Actinomyces ruminicola TaxID=332524 RepID=A0A1H0B7R6_9ACTO|nr:alpha/beta hydrolase fold domain-containing protein [Actinomyces ruminicola]SDN41684.1 Acetyl esterase/lipase [Actinomyces ruminicola]